MLKPTVVDRMCFSDRIELVRSYCEFAHKLKPNYFVTFNFRYSISPAAAFYKMKGFCAQLERKSLGRNWNKQPKKRRLTVLAFPEHPLTNAHWHAVMRVPKAIELALKGDGPKEWNRDFAANGQLWVVEIDDLDGMISYITKRLHDPGAIENVFIYGRDKRQLRNGKMLI